MSGRELFYLTPSNELVVATVTPASVRERRVLFTRPATMALNIATATCYVSLDDARFLMIRSSRASRGQYRADNAGGRLVMVELVLNWLDEPAVKIRATR